MHHLLMIQLRSHLLSIQKQPYHKTAEPKIVINSNCRCRGEYKETETPWFENVYWHLGS